MSRYGTGKEEQLQSLWTKKKYVSKGQFHQVAGVKLG